MFLVPCRCCTEYIQDLTVLKISCAYVLEIGEGWEPARMETEQEWDLILANHRSTFPTEYFIGGTTDSSVRYPKYCDYSKSDGTFDQIKLDEINY